MGRMVDADALMDDVMERYCKDCDKRKGIKSGKWRIVYEIGDVPCRACSVDDMKDELENAPTVDAVEVVRCKDCKEYYLPFNHEQVEQLWTCMRYGLLRNADDFCSRGERRTDEQT